MRRVGEFGELRDEHKLLDMQEKVQPHLKAGLGRHAARNPHNIDLPQSYFFHNIMIGRHECVVEADE